MGEFLSSFRLGFVLLLYIVGPFLIIWLYQRYKFLSKVGTIVMAYAVGIIMSLTGLTHLSAESAYSGIMESCQGSLQSICVPLAIPLMLFSANFKAWVKNLKSTFVAFLCGVVAVVGAVMISFLLLKGQGISELDKAAGLMIGFYTGGTPNVASINVALKPSPETFLLVNTFEIFITFFFLAFLVAGGYKLIRKVLIYRRERPEKRVDSNLPGERVAAIEAEDFENYSGFLSAKIVKPLCLPVLCAIGIFAFAGIVSKLVLPPIVSSTAPAGLSPDGLQELISSYMQVSVVLIITTLAIALSFIPRIRHTPRMFEVGMYFILVFSIVIASQFDAGKINRGAMGLMLFILCVLVLSITLHLLLSKLFRVDADLFTISIVGLVFSPPFVPTVAGLMKSRRCLISGIVVGLLGYAVGNYLGIAMYYLTQYL